MQLFAGLHRRENLRSITSRAQLLAAPPHSLGPSTEFLRQQAVLNTLSIPLSLGTSPRPASDAPPSPVLTADADDCSSAVRALIPLLPEQCFISMAGGEQAYANTPASERQEANLRTVCAFAGKSGDNARKLASLISKLQEYRKLRALEGPAWPLLPCILANFAVWLQVNSPKEGATSVAPRCISIFSSASLKLGLPVMCDSPHLGAVPAHQASGDGYTGFMPLDIMHVIERLSSDGSISSALRFDSRVAYTIWRGSCRVQDWVRVSPAEHSLAPTAAAVFKISLTKNGERNTLFALSNDGMSGTIAWTADFLRDLRDYGPSPPLSTSDYAQLNGTLLRGTNLTARAFGPRMQRLIYFAAKLAGYTLSDLKSLHITAHSLHGSFAAYAEALEWHPVPQHRLGRWKLPQTTTVRAAKSKRGAGAVGAKSIAAVYSTAASCQMQLSLRARMMHVLATIGPNFSTHGDMSCFIENELLRRRGMRGTAGHESSDA